MRLDVLAVCYTLAYTDLLPVVAWFCRRRREQAAEEQVRGEIDHEDEKEECDGEVRRSGADGAMQKGIVDGEIQILIRRDESRSDQNGQENRRLQFPAATVVAQPAE